MPKSSRDKSSRTSLTPGPGEFHPETDERGVAVGGGREPGRGAPDMAKATGRSAAGGAFDARDGPGPGEHHPDPCSTMRASPLPRRRACAGASPPTRRARRAPRRAPARRVRGVARARDGRRDDAEGTAAVRTGGARRRAPPRAGGPRAGTTTRAAPDDGRGAPATPDGERARAPAPEDAAAARGAAAARAAARRARSPPRPGVGEYEAFRPRAFADRGKGVKMPSRAPWERLAPLEASLREQPPSLQVRPQAGGGGAAAEAGATRAARGRFSGFVPVRARGNVRCQGEGWS